MPYQVFEGLVKEVVSLAVSRLGEEGLPYGIRCIEGFVMGKPPRPPKAYRPDPTQASWLQHIMGQRCELALAQPPASFHAGTSVCPPGARSEKLAEGLGPSGERREAGGVVLDLPQLQTPPAPVESKEGTGLALSQDRMAIDNTMPPMSTLELQLTHSPPHGGWESRHDRSRLQKLPRPKLAQGQVIENHNDSTQIPPQPVGDVSSKSPAGIVLYEEQSLQLPPYLYLAKRRPAAQDFMRQVWELIPTLPSFDSEEAKSRLVSYTQLETFLPGTKWEKFGLWITDRSNFTRQDERHVGGFTQSTLAEAIDAFLEIHARQQLGAKSTIQAALQVKDLPLRAWQTGSPAITINVDKRGTSQNPRIRVGSRSTVSKARAALVNAR